MKERLKKERKIIVYKADSTEQEIRFFVNENQFVKATEEGDDIVVTGIHSETNSTDSKKSFIEFVKIIKEHKKIFAIVLFSLIIFCLVHLLLASFVPVVALFSFGLLLPIFTIIEIGILEYGRTTFLERSKHSAEHMMSNFLEANSRLPKNIQEIKSVSRFSKSCGSRFIMGDFAKNIIPYIISLLEALICTVILSQIEKCSNFFLMLFAIIFNLKLCINYILLQNGKYDNIINKINQWLNYFFQCCNTTTTKKVRQDDILVAFYAAKYWLKIVYPEFFSDDNLYCEKNENEDI